MTRLRKYNDLTSEHSDTQGHRPSIYAAFTLARLVHSFISRVKSNVHSRQRSNKPSLDVSAIRSYHSSVHSNPGNYGVDRIDHSSPTTFSKHSRLQQHVGPSIDRHCACRRGLASKSSTIE